MAKPTLFYNAKIILQHTIIDGGVLVENGKIKSVIPAYGRLYLDKCDGYTQIDVNQQYLSPGFIDIHIHGGGGYDCMDGSEKAFIQIAKTRARGSTPSPGPTTLTPQPDGLDEAVQRH